jgi:hypothetical protein
MNGNGLVTFAFIPAILLGLLFYGLVFFCIWKFYEMLSKINDNIAGIRQALNRNASNPPAAPDRF